MHEAVALIESGECLQKFGRVTRSFLVLIRVCSSAVSRLDLIDSSLITLTSQDRLIAAFD